MTKCAIELGHDDLGVQGDSDFFRSFGALFVDKRLGHDESLDGLSDKVKKIRKRKSLRGSSQKNDFVFGFKRLSAAAR
jgi:hypothetical protein